MAVKKHVILSLLLFLILSYCATAQPHNIIVQISNQPNNSVILGSIKGDTFTPIDSAMATDNTVNFQVTPDLAAGMYRIVLGYTPIAKALDESPQQLNFIYNNENVELKTDFRFPTDSVEVIRSVENKIWFDFLKKEKEIRDEILMLEKEVDYYWSEKDTLNAVDKANVFNQLQLERESLIGQTVSENEDLFAARLIKMYHEPLLDGYVDAEQRDADYKSAYFNQLDFTDETLINSSIYTDKIFQFLVAYNRPEYTQEQRENEYKKAIDVVFSNIIENERVSQFILDYLLEGFEILGMDSLINYLTDKYSDSTLSD